VSSRFTSSAGLHSDIRLNRFKVCIVCTQPYESSPRIIRTAASLAKNYSVHVIEFGGAPPFTKSDELIKGIRVTKIRARMSSNNFLKAVIFLLKMLPLLLQERADVYHCFGLTSLVVGVFTKLLIHKKLIYDCFEHYPYQFAGPYLPRTLWRKAKWVVISRLEELLAKVCNHVIVVPSYRNELGRRFTNSGISVSVIANFPSTSLFSNSLCVNSRAHLAHANKEKVLLYTGGKSRYLELREILKSISLLVTKYSSSISFKMLLVRPESEWKELLAYVKTLKLEGIVKIIRSVSYFDIPKIYKLGDIALVLYQPTYWTLRSKASERLFESMLFGLPLVVSDFPGLREIVMTYQCGVLVDPTDPIAISNAILYLLENPEVATLFGENGRRAIMEELNWEREESKLENIYTNLFAIKRD